MKVTFSRQPFLFSMVVVYRTKNDISTISVKALLFDEKEMSIQYDNRENLGSRSDKNREREGRVEVSFPVTNASLKFSYKIFVVCMVDMFKVRFHINLLHGMINNFKSCTQVNYCPLWMRSLTFKTSAFVCQRKPLKSKGKNCVSFEHSSLFSDERESHFREERAVFVRDVPRETPGIKVKLRDYFSSFGEVECVWRIRQDMMLVSFVSVESVCRVLKEKHFFQGQWITTLPNVKKGCWKGKSCKIKVDNVPQCMSKEELVKYFSKFGNVTDIDFIILDPDTLKRKDFCFVEFSNMSEATGAALVEQHKVGHSWLRVSLSSSKLSAVKNPNEIIVRSLPHGVTVDSLKEYFQQFGDLEQVDLICQALARPHTSYAFVKFQSPCVVEKVTDNLVHIICGKRTVVQKSALLYPIKNGESKIFVEGFQPQTNPERVRAYFEQFGKVKHIIETAICPTGKTFVTFKSKASLQHVLRQKEHVLDGSNLRVRAVSWRKLDLMTAMINTSRPS